MFQAPALRFPSMVTVTYKANEPFPSHADLSHGVYDSDVKQPRTVMSSVNCLQVPLYMLSTPPIQRLQRAMR